MRGIKILQQDFALKCRGDLCAGGGGGGGGAYLWDTTIYDKYAHAKRYPATLKMIVTHLSGQIQCS